MKNWITNAAVLGGTALALAVISPAPAAADLAITVRGVVDRLPDTPDRTGEWLIDGHVVAVDAGTRIEERSAHAGVGVGRVVKAKVEPGPTGDWRAVEIELSEKPGRHTAR